MQAVWDWLITDAGAGWVLGILGITWALYTWTKRERPGKVVVREIDKFRLLEISPSQHPSLTFLYPTVQGTQTSITNLQQTKLIIYNVGTRDITDPVQLALKVGQRDMREGARGYWKLIIESPEATHHVVYGESKEITKAIVIDLPYLNAYDTHKHVVRLFLISELDMSIELVDVHGKGWSTIFVPLADTERKLSRVEGLGAFLIIATGICLVLFGIRILYYFYPNAGTVDPGLIGFVPTLAPLAIFLTFYGFNVKRITALYFKQFFGIEPTKDFRFFTEEEQKAKKQRLRYP